MTNQKTLTLCRRGPEVTQQNLIMGILNITPDSFSDGGHYFSPEKALERAYALLDQGADFLDIGAESSRPGASPLSQEEEWERLSPVLEVLCKEQLGARVSVDTYKPWIMEQAALMGVGAINDITGSAPDETLRFLASRGLTYIAMHMHGKPCSMQESPLDHEEALLAVADFYKSTMERLLGLGFAPSKVWLDPGIGFGKTDKANIKLLSQAVSLADTYSLVIGISRKSFIGRILKINDPVSRDKPSKMLELGLMMQGVKAIRTHHVESLYHLRELLH